MSNIKNKDWWKAAAIRAIKTVIQTLIAGIGAATAFDQVNWIQAISAALFAGVLSLLTSLAKGLPEVKLKESGEWKIEDDSSGEDDDSY